ncbi:MAG: hypothetical protein R3E11_11720 [Sphingobium sp.]|nr:hypothetical protein [Sphingobium sp.]
MRALGALLLALMPFPAFAQAVVVSDAPVSTSVTVYRDGDRDEGAFNLRWLQGYALISETRRISLPAGPSVVRFEGVADGMIAVSAVVSGLPGGVDEKNRDARLLSPASLLDGTLGNRVHIRRTSRQTGKVTEVDAIIRSGPDNAVVLETPDGIEALQCSGLPETLVYDEVPEGLSAKPTFSVHTNTPAATEAEVTLTYLATGFDWGASYVAKVAEDGKTLDLFAWLTVANGNGATYAQTQLLAVAGKPSRESDFREIAGKYESPRLNLQCWPMDSTSTYPAWGVDRPAPPPAPMMADAAESIVVTAMKRSGAMMEAPMSVAVVAKQEELGDLKLYRVPVRVDVVPNAQKQVALLQKQSVPFKRLYTATLSPWSAEDNIPTDILLRMQNKKAEGLGLPLPSGGVVVMQRQYGEDMLLGDGDMADKTIGEEVEIRAGSSDQVRIQQTVIANDRKKRTIRIIVTNALDARAPVEIMLPRLNGFDMGSDAKLKKKDGQWLWETTVPANGQRVMKVNYSRQ